MITLIGAGALAYSAMVGLCQATQRSQVAVWGRPLSASASRLLRVYGWLAVLLSLGLCARHWGWPMGSVAEFGLLSLAGWLLVLGLPYWPRSLVVLGGAAGAAGLGMLFYSFRF